MSKNLTPKERAPTITRETLNGIVGGTLERRKADRRLALAVDFAHIVHVPGLEARISRRVDRETGRVVLEPSVVSDWLDANATGVHFLAAHADAVAFEDEVDAVAFALRFR